LGSRFAARQRYDVVHTRDLETVPFALRLGCRVLFESHRPLTRRSRWHRRLLLRAATNPRFLGLVTHSRFIAAKYAADGIPAAKLRAIHNGYDPAPFEALHPPGEARALLGLAEQPTVVYAGRLAPLKRIDLLLEAAARSPEIQWVLAGATDTAEARPFIERGSLLPNVRFPGFLRGERLAFALQAADVLVLSPDRDAVRHPEQVGLPIKLFQYLAAGRPIVAPDVPDTAELLVHEQNSVRIPGAASLLGAVRELLSDPARRDRLGAGALESARGCTWDARATALLAFLAERRAAREPVA
jgi:glycosyltransferase involved in cell wall biosynthesis